MNLQNDYSIQKKHYTVCLVFILQQHVQQRAGQCKSNLEISEILSGYGVCAEASLGSTLHYIESRDSSDKRNI